MKPLIATLAALLTAAPALAEGDFSEGSQANSWNLFGEEKARFEGQVFDAICSLTGDCPEDCGGGARQMVILRKADQAFVLVAKNIQPVFSGATVDLAQYCWQDVEVDGLLIGDAGITPGLTAKLFQVQTVRVLGQDAAAKTDLWTRRWAEQNPDAPGEGPWFRRDPKVQAQIDASGRLGLGAEADQKYIEDNF